MAEDKSFREALTRRRLLGVAGAAAGAVASGAATARAATRRATAGAARVGETPAITRAQLASRTLDAPPAAGAWVELDRGAIVANLVAVRAKSGGRPVMGVIKANGYGHGLVPMAKGLSDAGVDALMVITVDEALAIREAGMSTPVLNYGPFDRDAAAELVRNGIDQIVYTREAVEGMSAAARSVGESARLQVVVDTGLGRVGAPPARAADVFAAVQEAVGRGEAVLVGTLTALSEDPEYDRVQLARFIAVCEAARVAGLDLGVRHATSSSGLFDFPDAYLDMVRPGITLYGHYPNDETRRDRPIELTPVASLRAKVAYVKPVQPGDSIGYHRAWVAERETTVATLPIGHSEGYPPNARDAGGHVEIRGHACPLVGGITSNHLEVAIPAGVEVRIGDIATLIAGGSDTDGSGGAAESAAPTAPLVAGWGDVSVYGLLMRLSPLLPRLVVGYG